MPKTTKTWLFQGVEMMTCKISACATAMVASESISNSEQGQL